MLTLDIPGQGSVEYRYLVLDYNGTMACDGRLKQMVEEKLNELADDLEIHILTADTFGLCRMTCHNIEAEITILTAEAGGPEKLKFIEELGAEAVIAVGNGTNDALMLARAGLGIVVTGPEGASAKAVLAADIVARDIHVALDMLLVPKRIIATLRA